VRMVGSTPLLIPGGGGVASRLYADGRWWSAADKNLLPRTDGRTDGPRQPVTGRRSNLLFSASHRNYLSATPSSSADSLTPELHLPRRVADLLYVVRCSTTNPQPVVQYVRRPAAVSPHFDNVEMLHSLPNDLFAHDESKWWSLSCGPRSERKLRRWQSLSMCVTLLLDKQAARSISCMLLYRPLLLLQQPPPLHHHHARQSQTD